MREEEGGDGETLTKMFKHIPRKSEKSRTLGTVMLHGQGS